MKPAMMVLGVALLATPALADQAQDAKVAEISHMHWLANTTATLPSSHGHLVVPKGYLVAMGSDAERLTEMANGKPGANDISLEGYVLVPPDGKSAVELMYVPTGFVDAGDFNTISPAALLDNVRSGTEARNAKRAAEGLPTMHVVGWLQQPTYNQTTHIATWAVEGSDSTGGDVANVIAVRLGREGYEGIRLITDAKSFQPIGNPLDVVANNFSFAPGEDYADHVSTDRVAGYGLAGLVGALIGAKAVKVAAVGGGLLLLKALGAKLMVLLLLPLAFAKSIIRRFRNRVEAVSNDP